MKKKSALQKRRDNPNSTYWRKKADAIWSQRIREGGECVLSDCGDCSGRLEAHHLVDRRRRLWRHDLDNGVVLCSWHHKYSRNISAHMAPLAFADYMRRWHNAKYSLAVHRSKSEHTKSIETWKEAYVRLAKVLEKGGSDGEEST